MCSNAEVYIDCFSQRVWELAIGGDADVYIHCFLRRFGSWRLGEGMFGWSLKIRWADNIASRAHTSYFINEAYSNISALLALQSNDFFTVQQQNYTVHGNLAPRLCFYMPQVLDCARCLGVWLMLMNKDAQSYTLETVFCPGCIPWYDGNG